MNLLYSRFGNTLSIFLAESRAKQRQWEGLKTSRPTGVQVSIRYKNPEADLRKTYWPNILRSSLITLATLVLGYVFDPEYHPTVTAGTAPVVVIQMEHIPETMQNARAPAPPRPKVPLAVEGEEVPEDVTIESTELDLDRIPLDLFAVGPPGTFGPVSDEPLDISEIDYKPHPIRIVAPEYPEAARRAKLEGKVTIRVLVDKNGKVEKTEVLNGPEIFQPAAVAAARQFRFRPGKHEGERRKVWMVMPIDFTLK